MFYEALFKVGDMTHPDTGKANQLFKDGDLMELFDSNDCQAKWDDLLSRGRVTQQEYDDALIVDKNHRKYPWGVQSTRRNVVFFVEGLAITDEQKKALIGEEWEDSGALDDEGDPILNFVRYRNYKIDFKTVSRVGGAKLSKTEKDAINDPNVHFPIDYDNPLDFTRINLKG